HAACDELLAQRVVDVPTLRGGGGVAEHQLQPAHGGVGVASAVGEHPVGGVAVDLHDGVGHAAQAHAGDVGRQPAKAWVDRHQAPVGGDLEQVVLGLVGGQVRGPVGQVQHVGGDLAGRVTLDDVAPTAVEVGHRGGQVLAGDHGRELV